MSDQKFQRSYPSNQSIWGLNFLLFCISDVRHGVGPLLSIYLRSSLNWDAAMIGLALATVEFSSFLAQIPAGLLADATHYKRTIVVVSCLIIISGCSIILSFPHVGPILFAQFLMGFSIALISPAISSITLGLFGRKKLPTRSAKNEMWNHFGNVSTAVIAGLTAFLLGNQWVFYIVIMFAVGSIAAVSLIRSKEIDYNVARELISPLEGGREPSQPVSILSLFKRKPIIIFNLSLILYFIANGSQMALLGQKLTGDAPSLGPLFIASSMTIAELTMIAVAFVMSFIVNRFGRKTFLLTAFLILPTRALLYLVSNNPYWEMSVQILDGMAAGILGVIGIVIISDLGVGTGRFNFLLGVAALSIGIGETASQLLGGLVAKQWGFDAAFIFLASVGILGSLFYALCMPETKSRNEQ